MSDNEEDSQPQEEEEENAQTAEETEEEEDETLDLVFAQLSEIRDVKHTSSKLVSLKKEFVELCKDALTDLDSLVHSRNAITLQTNPFIFTRNNGLYYLSLANCDVLYKAFLFARNKKNTAYASMNDRVPEKMPASSCNFRELAKNILAISGISVDWPKPMPLKRGQAPTTTFIGLTAKQLKTIVFWFIPYIPKYCLDTLILLDKSSLFRFYATVVEYSIISRCMNDFDLNLLKREAVAVRKDPIEQFKHAASDLTDKFCYVLHMGIILRKDIPHNVFKIGQTSTNQDGLYGRLSAHLKSSNFIDPTIVAAYSAPNPEQFETSLHDLLKIYRLKPTEWLNHSGKGETELFAIPRVKTFIRFSDAAAESSKAQDYPKILAEKTQQLEEKTQQLEEKIREITKQAVEIEEKTSLQDTLSELFKDQLKLRKLVETTGGSAKKKHLAKLKETDMAIMELLGIPE
jgi:hypothetical protein